MHDPKTNLPNGGGKYAADIRCGQGVGKITKFIAGTFKEGKSNGHYGIQIQKGIRYEGEVNDGYLDGIGKLSNKIKDSEESYYGEWKAGVRNGFGKYIDTGNNTIYVGEFKNGLWHGHGRVQYDNEFTYEGDFKFGKRHGLGKIVTDTRTYVGEWVRGRITGTGKLVNNDGSYMHIGTFYKGFPDGYGH